MREGQYDVNKLNYGRDLAVAGFERPNLVQTGTSGTQSGSQSGTQSGTTVQSQSPWGTILGTGASLAPLSL